MVVIQLRQDLLHDRLAVQNRLGTHPELLAIAVDGRHFAVVKVNYLPMSTHQSFLLLLQIFGIHSSGCLFLFLCHNKYALMAFQGHKIRCKVSILWNIIATFVVIMSLLGKISVRI